MKNFTAKKFIFTLGLICSLAWFIPLTDARRHYGIRGFGAGLLTSLMIIGYFDKNKK